MNAEPVTVIVVAALMRRGEEVLLVQQQGPDDPDPSWALPGGRVEPGELFIEALAREVREETGLAVLNPGRMLYLVQHDRRDGSGRTVVMVFEVAEWTGQIHADDPDGLVLDARFMPVADASDRLSELPWRTMVEPLVAYLRGEVGAGAAWFYRTSADGDQVELVARL